MSRFERIDLWARGRLGKAEGERVTTEEARRGLVLPNRHPLPEELRENPHLQYPSPAEALERIARADRFIENTGIMLEGEEEDEPHLGHYSESELSELARMGDEVLGEIGER